MHIRDEVHPHQGTMLGEHEGIIHLNLDADTVADHHRDTEIEEAHYPVDPLHLLSIEKGAVQEVPHHKDHHFTQNLRKIKNQ